MRTLSNINAPRSRPGGDRMPVRGVSENILQPGGGRPGRHSSGGKRTTPPPCCNCSGRPARTLSSQETRTKTRPRALHFAQLARERQEIHKDPSNQDKITVSIEPKTGHSRFHWCGRTAPGDSTQPKPAWRSSRGASAQTK